MYWCMQGRIVQRICTFLICWSLLFSFGSPKRASAETVKSLTNVVLPDAVKRPGWLMKTINDAKKEIPTNYYPDPLPWLKTKPMPHSLWQQMAVVNSDKIHVQKMTIHADDGSAAKTKMKIAEALVQMEHDPYTQSKIEIAQAESLKIARELQSEKALNIPNEPMDKSYEIIDETIINNSQSLLSDLPSPEVRENRSRINDDSEKEKVIESGTDKSTKRISKKSAEVSSLTSSANSLQSGSSTSIKTTETNPVSTPESINSVAAVDSSNTNTNSETIASIPAPVIIGSGVYQTRQPEVITQPTVRSATTTTTTTSPTSTAGRTSSVVVEGVISQRSTITNGVGESTAVVERGSSTNPVVIANTDIRIADGAQLTQELLEASRVPTGLGARAECRVSILDCNNISRLLFPGTLEGILVSGSGRSKDYLLGVTDIMTHRILFLLRPSQGKGSVCMINSTLQNGRSTSVFSSDTVPPSLVQDDMAEMMSWSSFVLADGMPSIEHIERCPASVNGWLASAKLSLPTLKPMPTGREAEVTHRFKTGQDDDEIGLLTDRSIVRYDSPRDSDFSAVIGELAAMSAEVFDATFHPTDRSVSPVRRLWVSGTSSLMLIDGESWLPLSDDFLALRFSSEVSYAALKVLNSGVALMHKYSTREKNAFLIHWLPANGGIFTAN